MGTPAQPGTEIYTTTITKHERLVTYILYYNLFA